MLETIAAVNQAVNNFVWGVPAMVCIIGVGLLLSVRTGFLQIRKFPYAIKTTIGRMFRKKDASDGAMTLLVNAVALDAAAAERNHDAFVGGNEFCEPGDLPLAENQLGRIVIDEIVHTVCLV